MSKELMKKYDDLRWELGLRNLPLKHFEEVDQEKVILFVISDFVPRVWKNLDNMLMIDKKENVTSRMTKLNGNSKKCKLVSAKVVVDSITETEFSFLDKLELVILNTIRNLLQGNNKKVERTLNTINTPKGQLMITIVSAYCLGQELITKFGEIKASKRLEATIRTKDKFQKELRQLFKRYDFEEAILYFKEMVEEYQELLFVKKGDISQIAHEEYLYNIADVKDVERALAYLTEKVRLEITSQPRLLIVE